MKKIVIQAQSFFDLLKERETSMWEIFSQMLDGEEKELDFVDDNQKIIFQYILPNTAEKLEEDRIKFTEKFNEKLKHLN